MSFSERLKGLRISRNLTQKQIYEAVGMSAIGYQRYEYGERKASDTFSDASSVASSIPKVEEPPEKALLKEGETGIAKDFEITLNSSEITDSVVAKYVSFSPEDGSKYLVINLTIKNLGKSASAIFPSVYLETDIKPTVLYDGEYEFEPSLLLGHDSDLHNSSLNPLTSKTGILAFPLPDEACVSDNPLVLQLKTTKPLLEFAISRGEAPAQTTGVQVSSRDTKAAQQPNAPASSAPASASNAPAPSPEAAPSKTTDNASSSFAFSEEEIVYYHDSSNEENEVIDRYILADYEFDEFDDDSDNLDIDGIS